MQPCNGTRSQVSTNWRVATVRKYITLTRIKIWFVRFSDSFWKKIRRVYQIELILVASGSLPAKAKFVILFLQNSHKYARKICCARVFDPDLMIFYVCACFLSASVSLWCVLQRPPVYGCGNHNHKSRCAQSRQTENKSPLPWQQPFRRAVRSVKVYFTVL